MPRSTFTRHYGPAARRRAAVLLLAACTLLPATASAASVRAQEIEQCLPGELATWADGRDRPAAGPVRLLYRHEGAPPWLDEAQVLGAVQRAAHAWAGCGVPAEVISDYAAEIEPATVNVALWSDAGTRGNFALADVGQRRLFLSAAMFRLLAQRNPRHPAHETLQMVISHEMGHFFGLMAHSRRCVDVMSYYDNGRGESCRTRDGGSYKRVPEYRALLPTACDLARCRQLNGTPR